MTTHHRLPIARSACAIVLSTMITAAIFGLVIVLPAAAETPPIPAQPAASAVLHTRHAGSASTPHRPPLTTRLATRPSSPAVDKTERQYTADGDVLEHRSRTLSTVSSGKGTLETRTVLRHHDSRRVGEQRIGSPGINYGPSRERSLQGRSSDSPTSVESFGFGYKHKLD